MRRMWIRARTKHVRLTAFALLMLGLSSCGGGDRGRDEAGQVKTGEGHVVMIADQEELSRRLAEAGDQLVLVDLYADWCGPCRLLSPVLEEIARERADQVSVFKVNVDENRELARAFGVTGIPLVVFLRGGERVHAITGVHPKATYLRAIERFGAVAQTPATETPDGELIDGVRVIRIGSGVDLGPLQVFRGETVRLVVEATGWPFQLSIPAFDILERAPEDRALEVSFKTAEVGVFPVFCNGRCPAGDGARVGQIVVVPLTSVGETRFTELTTEEARALIARDDPLILDVRTPQEFYSGHLEKATLIPLQQLEPRVEEIEAHRDRPVLLYCRSGNRSTVAAEILMRHGFKDLYNLRYGIRDWIQEGHPVVDASGSMAAKS